MLEFLEKYSILVPIVIFILGIIGFFIRRLFFNDNSNSKSSFIKAGGDIRVGRDITIGDKNTKITNIKSEQNPFLVLYVRNVQNYPEKRQKIKDEGYLITHEVEKTAGHNKYKAIEGSRYFLRLRNEGDGIALNVEMESDNFIIDKYQSRQIGISDEQSVKIIKKPSHKIRDLEKLNGEIFTICCDSQNKSSFCFKYKINDIENGDIKFLGKTNG